MKFEDIPRLRPAAEAVSPEFGRKLAAWDAVAAEREAQAARDPRLLVPLAEALARLRAELN